MLLVVPAQPGRQRESAWHHGWRVDDHVASHGFVHAEVPQDGQGEVAWRHDAPAIHSVTVFPRMVGVSMRPVTAATTSRLWTLLETRPNPRSPRAKTQHATCREDREEAEEACHDHADGLRRDRGARSRPW